MVNGDIHDDVLVLYFEDIRLLNLRLTGGGVDGDFKVALHSGFLPELINLAQTAVDNGLCRQVVLGPEHRRRSVQQFLFIELRRVGDTGDLFFELIHFQLNVAAILLRQCVVGRLNGEFAHALED